MTGQRLDRYAPPRSTTGWPQPENARRHRRDRVQQADARTLSGLAAEIGHLRTALEAVVGSVRQHEERLPRME